MIISLLLLLAPASAYAQDWKIWVFAHWERTDNGDGTFHNEISVSDAYPSECGVIRSIDNVGTTLLDGTINAEVYECLVDTATKDLIDADADYMLLFGDEYGDTSTCSDPTYTTQVDCETNHSYCSNNDPQDNNPTKCGSAVCYVDSFGNDVPCEWITEPRGFWTVSEGWAESLRPKSDEITSPEFTAVRNYMTRQGWNENGVDSCIGQQANGRSRWQIMEEALACIDAL